MSAYYKLNSMRNKLVHRDKHRFVLDKAKELEDAASKGNIGVLYRHLRQLNSQEVTSVGPIVRSNAR
ncbi:hypothetical protein QYM36_012054 [Artemia franciscana]|uniref:Uncharacterized protein n=1 Tax=Artemia franciscana TaxID=6661 RepID=A0AA88HKQ1_ARTSF|nr:hypothetical protein QYM36_012054 [Artemia franciscana]